MQLLTIGVGLLLVVAGRAGATYDLDASLISPKAQYDELAGRRAAAVWGDADPSLQWAFGGIRYSPAPVYTNDVWLHNLTDESWTWLAGERVPRASVYSGPAGPWPGGRGTTCAWSLYSNTTQRTARHFMFGGEGFAANLTAGLLGDLWEFVPTTMTWRFVAGWKSILHVGVYDVKLLASNATSPGSRDGSACWTSEQRYLWVSGGIGCDRSTRCQGTAGSDLLNDVWMYDTVGAKAWTWMQGADRYGDMLTFQRSHTSRTTLIG